MGAEPVAVQSVPDLILSSGIPRYKIGEAQECFHFGALWYDDAALISVNAKIGETCQTQTTYDSDSGFFIFF